MSPQASRSVLPALIAGGVVLLLLCGVTCGEELTLLNQIQERHEHVHTQVAPAVVAVQCRTPSSTQGFYGTGVVVSPQGLVVTSSTVVPATARSIQVFFPDGHVMDAKVLATDDATESCVLQVTMSASETQKSLPYVELADSAKAAAGELAYTAGNPFHTISRDGQVAWSVGTISGIYKIVSADEQSRYRGVVLETDAAVNPGSDGGPLLDANGRLLGILSLCFCESRWLGTAIPIHAIHQALPPLRALQLQDGRGTAKPNATPDPVPVSYEQTESANAARAIPDALRYVSRDAAHAVVKIIVKRADNTGTDRKAPLARRLRQRPDAPVSGVIIDPEGVVLTSAFNVAGDVAGIEVVLASGKTVPATLLGRHFGLDVAALKIQPLAGEKLCSIPLSEDPALQIGRFVTVLGGSEDCPVPTRTFGIVSAVARLDGCGVQTDAMINYGNSGGPVIDLHGRLVGLAAHVRTNADCSQQNSGVGFFTQSDKIIAALPDLKAGRDMKAPAGYFLDVTQPAPAPEARGVKLDEVVPGSIAAAAKLLAGDVIVAVDGMDTHSWAALVQILKAHKPGDTVEITYQRGTVTSRAQTVLPAGGK
jgi:putative serine protease PepD